MIRIALATAALAAARPAAAQPGVEPPPPAPEPAELPPAPEPAELPPARTDLPAPGELEEPERPGPAQQELGAALGMAMGGRVTPGGVHLEGAWLYRLAELDWFEAGIGFTFGGGAAACFRDRQDDLICDHGPLQGAAGELRAGIRRYFVEQGRGVFLPHAEAGLSVRIARYDGDDLTGMAIPLWLGGGVRATVYPGIRVGGAARLEAGPAIFGRGLELEPQIGLVILAGCDFEID